MAVRAVVAPLRPGATRRKSATGDAPLRQTHRGGQRHGRFLLRLIDAVADYLFQNYALGEFTACATNAPQRSSSYSFVKTRPGLQKSELTARTLSEKFPCK
jgi:hypothetical protein